ncbi:sensor histidine kinase [Myroides sp. 1354]|uniref:sensor histidine kinase n=1 Tax=unclassified Myroides TaxID=2642485 RepID=UPI0025753C5D|nr:MULTISPECIES: ATP-binding protein [unclassified Myroides]MDM1046072.1 sensor histidine kinase [Myroides sp. R163-1]MDM1057008.1 sensor histidine kinase [Myroides sp. 1354]MDM1070203.1 sensor histidine kinase [Myroides sp. 1372]
MQHTWQRENIIIIWFIIGLLLVLIISIAFIILLMLNYKKHIDTQHQINLLNQQHSKKLQLSSVDIQEKERQRIGSDLHDSVINALNILFLKSQAGQTDDQLVESIQETIQLTRSISHGLNPPFLNYASLENLIKDLFQQWNIFYTIKLYINKRTSFELTTEQKMHLLRIIQELMSNIHKHAQANQVEFQLRLSEKAVVFAMRDNGKGFQSKCDNQGLGLQNIQVRASLLKATFKYKQQQSVGTVFLFILPQITKP